MEPTYRIAQRLHERRAAVGLPKYGRHLDADSQGCMIVHALEEAADQVNYLLAEIQRRRHVIEKLESLAEEMRADKAPRWAFEMEKLSDLLGGPSALKQYDEILGGGTVAENATVAPEPVSTTHKWSNRMSRGNLEFCEVCGIVRRADDKNKPCRGPVAISLRTAMDQDQPSVEQRRMPKEQLDRIRQEIAKVAASDRPLTTEERETFDRAMAELPEAHEAPDPRDEALRVAEIGCAWARQRLMECLPDDAWSDSALGPLDTALAAIRAAGGVR